MTMTSDGSWREQPRERAIARCSTSKHARPSILRPLFAADLQIHETDSITNDHRSVASRLALSFLISAPLSLPFARSTDIFTSTTERVDHSWSVTWRS